MRRRKDLSSICYKKNDLSEVVARVDFVSPVESLATSLPKRLSTIALRDFPTAEARPKVTQEVRLASDKISTRKSEFTEWQFHGREREKTLAIAPTAVLVRYTAYRTYEELRDQFIAFLASFFKAFPDAQPGRLGLRYINSIEWRHGHPLDWGDVIQSKLLALMSLRPTGAELTRVFHNIEFRFDDFQLRFQFGMHNPDYPAVIRRKLFILDLDAYYSGLQDASDLPRRLDAFHSRIQTIFEDSVTDKYRESLNVNA